jgi:excisionase family DNA binding protein
VVAECPWEAACVEVGFCGLGHIDQHQLGSPDDEGENTDSVEVFDEYLTVNEIAKTLRLNGQTVRNMIDRGELRAVRVGQRRVRVLRADLDAFLADQTDAPAQLAPARRETFDERFAELEEQIKGLRARISLLERGQNGED